MHTDFNLFFGRVEYVVKAAPGTGIVSSMVLLSDDLDEIDWEFRGGITDSVQTNYYGKGYTGSYNRSTTNAVATPQATFHTYALDWSKEALIWSIDGQVIRTLKAADADGNGSQYPQTPMKISLSLWDGGDKDADPATVQWAGGYTPLPPPQPYTMYIKSVKVWNANPGQQYQYTDKSGSWKSIKVINETMASSSSSATHATQTLSLAPASPTYANSTRPVASNVTSWGNNSSITTAPVYNTTYGHNSSMLHSTSCSDSTTLSSNLSITAPVPSSFVTAARTAKSTPAETTSAMFKSASPSSPVSYTAAITSSSVSAKAAGTSGVATTASADSTTCSETSKDDSTPTAVAKSSSYASSNTLLASGSSVVSPKESTSQYIAAVTTPVAVSTPSSTVQYAPSSSLSVPVSAAPSASYSASAPESPVVSIQAGPSSLPPAAAVASTSSDCSDDVELMVPYTAAGSSTVSPISSPSVSATISSTTSAGAIPSSYVASVPTSSAPASALSSYAVSTPGSIAASSAPPSYAVSSPASTPVSTPQSYVSSTPVSSPVSPPSSYVAVPSSFVVSSAVNSTPSKQVLAAPAQSSLTVAQAVTPNSASSECGLTTVTVSGDVVTSTVTYTWSTTATYTAASSAAPSPTEPETNNLLAQTPVKDDEAVVQVNEDDDTTTTISSTTTHTRTMTSTLVSGGSTGTGMAYPYATGTGMPYPYVNGTRKEASAGTIRASGTGQRKPTASAIPFAGAGSRMEVGWVMMVVAGVVAGFHML